MDYECLRLEQQANILTVQLNNPPANTLSETVCGELCRVFQALPEVPAVRRCDAGAIR